MKKCANCKTLKVGYIEWSPDGPPDYYCSEKCYSQYIKKMHKKGLVWRATPLRKLSKEEKSAEPKK